MVTATNEVECKCGCGRTFEPKKLGSVYIRGHNSRGNQHALGRVRSPETRAKMSAAQKQRQGPAIKRFWKLINKDGPVNDLKPELGQCWLWTGALSWNGYGQFENSKAHVFSYEYHVGPVPKGKELDHLCRTRNCANYNHLEAVTHKVNVKRAYAAQRLEDPWSDSSTW